MAEIERRYADLHLHTNHSDGADPPAVVVARAARKKIAAIAITDHDTTSGIGLAHEAAAEHGIELIAAVEISTGYHQAEIHVLAYGIRVEHAPMQQALAELRTQRVQRADAIVEKLKSLDVVVDPDELAREAGPGAIGRLHIARVLYRHGVTKTVQEGFDRFIGQGRPAYVSKATLPISEAIALIHDAAGLAVLAHPGLNRDLRTLLPQLLLLPFDGIEVYHTHHSPGESQVFMELAREHGLLVTGGSDCHGNIKGRGMEIGKVRLSWGHFERLKERLGRG